MAYHAVKTVTSTTATSTTIILTTAVLLLPVLQLCAAWISETKPITTIPDPEVTGRFAGNETHSDHFKILERDGHSLLVGARNMVYNISLDTLTVTSNITWYSTVGDTEMCLMKGKGKEACQNYVRVLVKMPDGQLLVCGTNSYRPMCRYYRWLHQSNTLESARSFSGQASCPYDPNDNNTALVTSSGELYTATVADFSSRDPLIYRAPLRTQQYDVQWLNEPNFVSSFEFGPHIYFLFRETAVEYINCGKRIYSRVGRVCKSDMGGKITLQDVWTSFFKARLNCSVPGDYPFYMDEIQDSSGLITGHPSPSSLGQYNQNSNTGDAYLYTVFTTPDNSIPGSAVCVFTMKTVRQVFGGRFRAQRRPDHNWLPVLNVDTPGNPRPGTCVNDSRRQLPTDTLEFIKKHRLMDESVPSSGGRPVVVSTLSRSRFTKVAVDAGVRAVNGLYYDLIYIGTADGKVVKAVNVGSLNRMDTVVIEEVQAFSSGAVVTNLHVYAAADQDGAGKLVVVSNDDIVTVPLQRCARAATCSACVRLRDPYCAWDLRRHVCTTHAAHRSHEDKPHIGLLQDLAKGSTYFCQDEHLGSDNEPLLQQSAASTLALTRAGGSAAAGAHYTVGELVGAILGSMLLGLLLGVMVGYFARRWDLVAKVVERACGSGARRDKLERYKEVPPPGCHHHHHLHNRRNSASDAYLTASDTPILTPATANNKPINLVSNVLKTPNSKLPNSMAETKPASLSKKVYI